MAWDIALDPDTGDLMFGPTLDLIGVSGPELDKQRIAIRCKIPRGTFLYDEEGTLGSNLHLVSRSPSPASVVDARTYVAEALEDADGISVSDITIEIEEQGQISVHVKFSSTESLDLDTNQGFEDAGDQPEFDAIVPLGHLE